MAFRHHAGSPRPFDLHAALHADEINEPPAKQVRTWPRRRFFR
jgi:hypothetical protein